MSDVAFTGERLHDDDPLFGVDLAQHRAAYRFAIERARPGATVLDLGSGAGYGSAELADALGGVTALDRVAPLARSRRPGARFVRADLEALPFRPRSFETVVSFQVLEHFEDPAPYLGAVSRMVQPEGEAILTTPNASTSLGVNPYHLHEYRADELASTLSHYFEDVDIRGVGATPPVRRYLDARRRRIESILRLDPLGIRNRLPARLVETLFAFLAIVVRRGVRRDDALPEVTWRDFPIGAPGPVPEDAVDLLAICRGSRRGRAAR